MKDKTKKPASFDLDSVSSMLDDDSAEVVKAAPKKRISRGPLGVARGENPKSPIDKMNEEVELLKSRLAQANSELEKVRKSGVNSSETEKLQAELEALKAKYEVAGKVGPHEDPVELAELESKLSSLEAALGLVSTLTVPRTGETLEARLTKISASDIFVSEQNKRIQGLLSKEDPEIDRIKQSIEKNGQREPVLVVDRGSESLPRYELVYGSTRLFAICWINEAAESERQVIAKVVDGVGLTNADIYELSKAENEERRELSFYEQACEFQGRVNAELLDRPEASLNTIYELLGVARTHAKRQMRVAKIPLEVVAKFISPNVLTQRDCEALAKLVCDKASLKFILESKTLFESINELVRVLPSKSVDDDTDWNSEFKSGLKLNVGDGIAYVQSGKREGSYVIKVEGFSDEQIRNLLAGG